MMMHAQSSSKQATPLRARQQSRACLARAAAAGAVQQKQAQAISSIQEALAQKKFKAILLDQFGVLHNGQVANPHALKACQQLAESEGVPLFVVSNSSRRASGTIDRLVRLGFDASWIAGAVTSGELAFQHLLNRPTDWWRTLGRRVLHLTWTERGAVSLEGLNLEVVDQPEEADFILAHGTEAVSAAWGRPVRNLTLAQMNQFLDRCAHAHRLHKPLPMIVANPDLVTVNGSELVVMPGTLGKTYQELGGPVRLMGKPDRVIFEAALQGLGGGIKPEEVLVVGDSLQHDIAGAAAAGMDSLLVAGGIHAKDLLPASGAAAEGAGAVDREAMRRLCQEYGVTPTFVAPTLSW